MEHSKETEQRLIELEIKASYTEDLLDQLNQVLIDQQRRIDLLMREVARLGQQGGSADAGAARSLRDDLPPHY